MSEKSASICTTSRMRTGVGPRAEAAGRGSGGRAGCGRSSRSAGPARRSSAHRLVTSLTGQSYSGLCAIDSCNTQAMNFAWLLAQAGGAGGAPLADLDRRRRRRRRPCARGTRPRQAAPGAPHPLARRLASFSERVSGLPRWSSLPSAVGGSALMLALAGFWWDVATHIDKGRDQGPFGTAAHWPIMLGLAGIALAGYLAVILGCPDDEPTAVRLRGGWSAPLGGVLLLACGGFALMGFPLDDTWHRLFGQDVTLWGPTHVLMIGSASLATIACWVLLVEGRRSARRTGSPAAARRPRDARAPAQADDRRRLPDRPVLAAGRVRLRRPAVRPDPAPGDDHGRRRVRARHRAHRARPSRRASGRRLLPDHARRHHHGRRAGARPQHPALPALHRRGPARRARRLAAGHQRPLRFGAGLRRADRHGRPRRRVGVDPRLDADPVAGARSWARLALLGPAAALAGGILGALRRRHAARSRRPAADRPGLAGRHGRAA